MSYAATRGGSLNRTLLGAGNVGDRILAESFIESHEVARADRFSDEINGIDLRRVKNLSSDA